jgi:phosphatidylinositol glycan class O
LTDLIAAIFLKNKTIMGFMERRTTMMEWVSPVLAVVGLYIFATSFFLAKRSLPHTSECDANSARDLLQSALGLHISENDATKRHFQQVLSQQQPHSNNGDEAISSQGGGCWMDRRVDAVAVIVVDALRFDFARERLPNSIGSRLEMQPNKSSPQTVIRSQLLQFVADPPTVTMQRLKGLTTGGLPTFADISGSFGGATVDEDSWVNQLHQVPPNKRGYHHSDVKPTPHKQQGHHRRPRMAFVGDDTWVDLFPHQFDPDSFPYPSFNTRDLDTVDNGCLAHLPGMLQRFGSSGSSSSNHDSDSFLELIVAHFLGVDHVGHTYGPNNHHMDEKLHQMDGMLSDIFKKIDDAPSSSCQVAFVFGDHGMTEDGNHGGGTDEETHAGLFVHYSPGCISNNNSNMTDEDMNHFSVR